MRQLQLAGPWSSAPDRGGYYGWRIVKVLAVAQLVSWGVLYYAFTALLVPMQRDLGLSPGVLTGAFGLCVATAGVAAVPVGWWIDRHGGRALMSVAAVGAALLVLAWSRVQSVADLYATFVGLGLVSAAVLYDPAFAVTFRWFRAQREQAVLLITFVGGFASTLFVPLTAALEAELGWRRALWVLAALLVVLCAAPYAVVLRRDPAALGLFPDGAAEVHRPSPDATPAATPLWSLARRSLRDSRVWLLATAFGLQGFAVAVVAVHLLPFLLAREHAVAFAAAAAGSLGLLSVAGRLLLTAGVRRWSVGTLTAGVCASQASGCAVLVLAGTHVAGVVAFLALFGLGFGVSTVARPLLTVETLGEQDYATYSALVGLVVTAAKASGPVLAGVMSGLAGGYDPVWLLTSLLCVAAAVVTASLRTYRARP